MKEGTVKFYNYIRGFGFISPEDSTDDIFVHKSGLIDNINDNDKVSYEEGQGKNGVNAINVRVINGQ